MNTSIRHALVAGAVVVAGFGIAGAAMQTTPAKPPQNSSHPGGHGRGGGQRFFAEYDLNHDGKVTRDEFNKVSAQRFAEATHGGKVMNQQQYAAFRTRTLQQRADQIFRRADWNGDNKLSFDEFAGPLRASFERADKQSVGFIVCHPQTTRTPAPTQGHRRSGGGSRGAGGFCSHDDLNHDGKVTRAELDQALHQQFAAAAKGGLLTRDEFLGMQSSRAQETSERAFQRLDTDHDGKLTFAEFSAAQERTFQRMDKNGDGVITRDELTSTRRTYGTRSASRS